MCHNFYQSDKSLPSIGRPPTNTTDTHAHSPTHTRPRTHTHPHKRTFTLTHARTHTHSLAHINTHRHTALSHSHTTVVKFFCVGQASLLRQRLKNSIQGNASNSCATSKSIKFKRPIDPTNPNRLHTHHF